MLGGGSGIRYFDYTPNGSIIQGAGALGEGIANAGLGMYKYAQDRIDNNIKQGQLDNQTAQVGNDTTRTNLAVSEQPYKNNVLQGQANEANAQANDANSRVWVNKAQANEANSRVLVNKAQANNINVSTQNNSNPPTVDRNGNPVVYSVSKGGYIQQQDTKDKQYKPTYVRGADGNYWTFDGNGNPINTGVKFNDASKTQTANQDAISNMKANIALSKIDGFTNLPPEQQGYMIAMYKKGIIPKINKTTNGGFLGFGGTDSYSAEGYKQTQQPTQTIQQVKQPTQQIQQVQPPKRPLTQQEIDYIANNPHDAQRVIQMINAGY